MPGTRVEDEAEESLSDVDINADIVLATEQEEKDKRAIWNEINKADLQDIYYKSKKREANRQKRAAAQKKTLEDSKAAEENQIVGADAILGSGNEGGALGNDFGGTADGLGFGLNDGGFGSDANNGLNNVPKRRKLDHEEADDLLSNPSMVAEKKAYEKGLLEDGTKANKWGESKFNADDYEDLFR